MSMISDLRNSQPSPRHLAEQLNAAALFGYFLGKQKVTDVTGCLIHVIF
jgi:hypothetical protein